MGLKRFKSYTEKALKPVSDILSQKGVSPNHITFAGVLMSLASGVSFYLGSQRTAAVFLTLSGVCDILDGNMARTQGKVSDFGAFLDSTLDRYSDMFVLFGIAGWAFNRHDTFLFWMVLLAVLGSIMVSYTRARAESLIDRCDVGIMERPERVVVLILTALFDRVSWGVVAVAALANITAVQRIVHTYRTLSRDADIS